MSTSDTWHELARMLIGDPELTGAEVAEQAGIDFEDTRRLWRALGFPPVPDDQRIFARSDVAVLRQIYALNAQQGTDPEIILQLTRVTGQSLARVAEAQVASSSELSTLLGADLSEQDKIALIATRIGALLPHLEPLLGYVWRRHMLAALLRLLAASGKESAAGRTLVVGFADLVGFTAISQQLDERELAAMVDRFEQLAYEHIPHHGGRVVKMIGDEVMFSVDDVSAAAEIALALVEANRPDTQLPEVRAGLALGKTLSWEGDLFGPTVNLASRLVNIARPSTVLISDELASALPPTRFSLRTLRPLTLKGIGRTRVTVLRRPEPAGSARQSRRRERER